MENPARIEDFVIGVDVVMRLQLVQTP